MRAINLAQPKAKLSEAIDRVEAGETIEITRRGKVAARIMPVAPVTRDIDFTRLERLWATMSAQTRSTSEFVREMRDEAEY